MTPARRGFLGAWPAIVVAVAGFLLFQFFGNASRGYIHTSSLFYWWGFQWWNPASETEHGWLILAIGAWVFARNLRAGEGRGAKGERREGTGASEWVAAAAIMAGLALHVVGFVAQQTRISIVAALVFAWGVLALGNRRWARAAAFPLGFMVFAIPLNVLDSAGFWLRMWVIDASTTLAHAAGIGVVRSGTQLFAPDGRYQYDVAAACSGVRSLMALAALSLLVGYLNFRAWWRRALMLVLCFPLTYLGNLLRIGAIIVAAQAGGQRWGERAHDVMGFGVFVVVLGGVLGAARLLERWWPEGERGTGGRRRETGDRGQGTGDRGRAAAVALMVLALTAADMFFLARVAATPTDGGAGVQLADDGKNPVTLPAFLGTEWIGRSAQVTAVEREVLPEDTGFSRRDYVLLRNPAHTVFLSIVLSGRDRSSIHRPELCLVAQGWTIRSEGRHAFGWPTEESARMAAPAVPATVLRTERAIPGKGVVPAVVAYWFVSSDAVEANYWRRVLRDAWNRLHGRADRWAYVLMQTDAQDGDAAALGRMQAVLNETLPAFQAVR
ncbi:MAG TPA: exosortase/archaeosortase family protein [Opitutus sp.]|nr:exosortase/archaeosortase family protein [Opitutus sp.]